MTGWKEDSELKEKRENDNKKRGLRVRVWVKSCSKGKLIGSSPFGKGGVGGFYEECFTMIKI